MFSRPCRLLAYHTREQIKGLPIMKSTAPILRLGIDTFLIKAIPSHPHAEYTEHEQLNQKEKFIWPQSRSLFVL